MRTEIFRCWSFFPIAHHHGFSSSSSLDENSMQSVCTQQKGAKEEEEAAAAVSRSQQKALVKNEWVVQFWGLPNNPSHEKEEGDALSGFLLEVGDDLRHFRHSPAHHAQQSQHQRDCIPPVANTVLQIPLHPHHTSLVSRTFRHRPSHPQFSHL